MTDVTRLRAAIDAIKNGVGDRDAAATEFGRAFGLRPAKRGRLCLARFTGGRCTRNRAGNASCAGCRHHSVFDHSEFWAREDDTRASVITAQPYGMPDKARYVADTFGVTLAVSADLSWHLPGSTTLLVFDRRNDFELN